MHSKSTESECGWRADRASPAGASVARPRHSLGGGGFAVIRSGFWRCGNGTLTGISIADDVADQLGGVLQGFVREVRVALRGARMRVTEQALHDVERDPLVDEEARIGVTQIV